MVSAAMSSSSPSSIVPPRGRSTQSNLPPNFHRHRIVPAAFLDLPRHDHGLLDAIVDIEPVAVAAVATDRVHMLGHHSEIFSCQLLIDFEGEGIVSAVH